MRCYGLLIHILKPNPLDNSCGYGRHSNIQSSRVSWYSSSNNVESGFLCMRFTIYIRSIYKIAWYYLANSLRVSPSYRLRVISCTADQPSLYTTAEWSSIQSQIYHSHAVWSFVIASNTSSYFPKWDNQKTPFTFAYIEQGWLRWTHGPFKWLFLDINWKAQWY